MLDGAAVAPLFSARESEIVALIALGFEDKQIAAMLGISRRTVRTHLERLYLDLQIHSRAAAVALWMTDHRPLGVGNTSDLPRSTTE